MPPEATLVSQVERVLALKAFPTFGGLSPQELAVVAQHVRQRRFRPGARLLRAGAPVRSLHFIVSGGVEVTDPGGGTHRLGEHDVLGGLAALTHDDRGEDAVAVEETLTLQLGRDEMEEVFEDSFPIFLAMLRVMTRAIVEIRKARGPSAGYGQADLPSETGAAEDPGLVERILLLRKTMNFGDTRIEALADIARDAAMEHFEAGHVIWNEGEAAGYSLVVARGAVSCETSNQQRFEFGPLSVVGGLDSLADQPRWYGLTAKTSVHALRIDTQSLLDVVEDNMEMATDMLRVFAVQAQHLERGENEGARALESKPAGNAPAFTMD